MFKACPIAILAFLIPPLTFAGVSPADRLEGDGIMEGDPEYFDENYYLSEENPFAPASEGDDDLGEQVILRRQSKRNPVRVRADTFLFWSDNVASVSSGEQEGWFFGASASAHWKQRLTANLFFDGYAYQDAYLYDEDDLDFQSTEVGVGLVANLPFLDDLTVFGRYEFLYVHADNPLFGTFGGNENSDSRYHRLRVGAYKPLYSKPSHLVSLSTNASWDFDASSGTQRRQQVSARLAYSWSATGRLRVTSFYRASFRDYLASSREDWNHYLGLELNYTLNSWSRLFGSILYGINESNTNTRDYEAFQAGIGLGVHASF